MATVTCTTDADLAYVQVVLSGWSADGPVTLYRVHQDGSRHEVHGLAAVSGGGAVVRDYESPIGAPVTYEAADGAVVSSAPVTIPVGDGCAWLTAPGLPSYGGQYVVTAKPSLARGRAAAVLWPIGRGAPVVQTDALRAPSMTLLVRTYTDEQAYSLTAMLEVAPTLLLRMPGTRVTDWCYVSVLGIDEDPAVHYRPQPGAALDDVAHWAVTALSLQVTDAPVGDVYGDPTLSWDALVAQYGSWDAVVAAEPTWLDVLAGW